MTNSTMHLPAMPPELASKYPHVWNKIAENWGTIFVPPYLHQLVVNPPDRGGRAGFSPKAMEEILSLASLHDDWFPQHAPLTNLGDDRWIDEKKRK